MLNHHPKEHYDIKIEAAYKLYRVIIVPFGTNGWLVGSAELVTFTSELLPAPLMCEEHNLSRTTTKAWKAICMFSIS